MMPEADLLTEAEVRKLLPPSIGSSVLRTLMRTRGVRLSPHRVMLHRRDLLDWLSGAAPLGRVSTVNTESRMNAEHVKGMKEQKQG
ncbi:MAG TPA: hypothetical protein VKB92_07905 [Myxococcales bacterium]|nr:hypothetical protein [Myxococcales bacterium]